MRPEQWMQYKDKNGPGYAESDLILTAPEFSVIFELKRTFALYGLVQLGQLYGPLVRRITGRPTYELLVCRNLTGLANDKFLIFDIEGWFEKVAWAHRDQRTIPILTLNWRE